MLLPVAATGARALEWRRAAAAEAEAEVAAPPTDRPIDHSPAAQITAARVTAQEAPSAVAREVPVAEWRPAARVLLVPP